MIEYRGLHPRLPCATAFAVKKMTGLMLVLPCLGCNLTAGRVNYADRMLKEILKGDWMRGPGYRTSGDVRRTWRCANCGRERKQSGEVTSLLCGCRDGEQMQIVVERRMAPRPLQRPSDLDRHPIDFGIEPPPPPPPKPEATIIKSAISREPEPVVDPPQGLLEKEVVSNQKEPEQDQVTDDWGDGFL